MGGGGGAVGTGAGGAEGTGFGSAVGSAAPGVVLRFAKRALPTKQDETARRTHTLQARQATTARTSPMPSFRSLLKGGGCLSSHDVGRAVGAGEIDGAAVEGAAVGAGEVVGASVVGNFVGDGVGQLSRSSTCVTPHDVDAHGVPPNALSRSTPSSTHQPRSWSKAGALPNIDLILVTLSTCHPPMSWLKAEASANIVSMRVTLWTAQAPMSRLKALVR